VGSLRRGGTCVFLPGASGEFWGRGALLCEWVDLFG
jgi:hypothetical protein